MSDNTVSDPEWSYFAIPDGTLVSGTFLYSTSGTDEYPDDPGWAVYEDAPISMTISAGSSSAQMPGQSIMVTDNPPSVGNDTVQFYYYSTELSCQMLLLLHDYSGTLYDSDAIPESLNLSDFEFDRLYMFFVMSGDMTIDVTALTPVSPVRQILDFIGTSVDAGRLEGNGPTARAARGRFGAFVNMIEAAGDLIDSGDIADACVQLQDAYNRVDGISPPPDFVTGEAAPELAVMIHDLMTALGCP